VEGALVGGWLQTSYDHDDWTHNEPPAVPKMTTDEALQLLRIRVQHARAQSGQAHFDQRRGEPRDVRQKRMGRQYLDRLSRDTEDLLLYQVLQNGDADARALETPIVLPALDQVTGWSKKG
jgi:hypothetical protein